VPVEDVVTEVRVRDATPDDLEWLRERVVDSSVFSIPYGRDVSNTQVMLAADEDFSRLLAEEDHVAMLIAENEDAERMGFLILNLEHTSDATGERQSLIEDLDVEPRFWGTPAVNRLVKRAAQVTAEHGLPYMVGHVSEGNRRTLLKSLRLGFQVERYHMAMGCTPDGPAPMPGRDESERAHDISRKQRRAKSRKRPSS
jgi:hypothetical protein